MPEMPVPVVEIGDAEIVTGLELRFVCITRPGPASVPQVASVHAFAHLLPVASLTWAVGHDEEGDIGLVYVRPDWRRRGVATALMSVAVDLADANGWPAPRHVARRTPQGDAWARHVGGELPNLELSDSDPEGERAYNRPGDWPGSSCRDSCHGPMPSDHDLAPLDAQPAPALPSEPGPDALGFLEPGRQTFHREPGTTHTRPSRALTTCHVQGTRTARHAHGTPRASAPKPRRTQPQPSPFAKHQ